MEIDWENMTAEDIYRALGHAPLIAGPWLETDKVPPLRRTTPGGATVVWDIAGRVTVHAWAVRESEPDALGAGAMDFPSRAEADRYLLDHGWKLVGEAP